MRADHVAVWNAGLIGTVGLGLSLYPAALLGLLRVEDPAFPVLALARSLGVVCIVLAVILWSARAWLGSRTGAQARRLLAAAYSFGGVLLLFQQIAIWNNRAGLTAFVTFAGWAVAYAMSTEATLSQGASA